MADFNGFMQKFGNMFSGDENIGRFIIDQFDRHGMDTASVTMDAVQNVCRQLRGEAESLLQAVNVNQQQAAQIIDKVDKIDQSVQAAAAAAGVPLDNASLQPPPPGPDMGAPTGAATPDQSIVPPNGMGGAAPEIPPEAAPSPSPEAASMETPPEAAAPAPEEAAPPAPANWQTLSDATKKNIEAKKSSEPQYRARKQHEPKMFVPGKGMIAAARRSGI